jgi:2-polyprenyl-3-methyl-5-hydroxy-6-metoxy-1,4-benzoquinol methylase
MIKELKNCLCCDSTNLVKVLDLNNQPLANSYLSSSDQKEDVYPLAINFCQDCTHIQLTHAVDPNLLFKNYLYVSGTTQTLKDYFDWFVDFVSQYVDGDTVLDIACNDGSQLNSFKQKGYTTFGIDPAENLYHLSSKDHTVVCDYFTESAIKQLDKKFDVITAQNVFAHNTYPLEFLQLAKECLTENGKIFIQTSQADMVWNKQFDTIYHEHISFFSVRSFKTLVERAGLYLIDVIRTHVHGTSFVFVVSKHNTCIKDVLGDELPLSVRIMEEYSRNCRKIAREIVAEVDKLKEEGYKVIGYGAAAKGNTFLNFSKFTLDYIVDDNPLKQGMYTPGSKILIKPPQAIALEKDKLIVVPLAWNFFDEIREKVIKQKSEDVKFLKYFPIVGIVS